MSDGRNAKTRNRFHLLFKRVTTTEHADTIIVLKAWTYAVTFGGQIPSGRAGCMQSMLSARHYTWRLHVSGVPSAQPQIHNPPPITIIPPKLSTMSGGGASDASAFAPFGDPYEYGRPRQRTRNSRRRQQQASRNPYMYSTRRRRQPLLFRWLGPMTTRKRNTILFSSLAAILVAWFLTPISDYVADVVMYTVPIDSDIELGLRSWESMKGQYPPVRDAYGVKRIGWDLVNSMPSQQHHIEWDFGVVQAPFANAFALPGGIVRVTDGLLQQLHLSDAEIAALIGHEMGHVLHRHSQKKLMKQQMFSTILGAIVYEDNDGYEETFGEAVSEILLKGASWLGEQSFSRRDEYQADEAAWEILVASNKYDPRAVAGMLSKLWSLEGGEGKTRWDQTHPGTSDRIEALQEKWNGLSYQQKKQLSSYPIL